MAADPSPPQDLRTSPENIFLIGYRGAGKTTVARLLAERLGWQWADADQLLEARHGRSIRQIFASQGEAAFRALEADVLEVLCRRRRHVVATGGGVVVGPANRERLRAAGRVVWLTADAATLWQRLQRDATTVDRRPDLSTGGLAEVEQLLAAREPFYRACADLCLDTAGQGPETVVRVILAHWNLAG